MKDLFLCSVLYASTLFSVVAAKALLAVFKDTIVLGETYEVEWLLDETDVSPATIIDLKLEGHQDLHEHADT